MTTMLTTETKNKTFRLATFVYDIVVILFHITLKYDVFNCLEAVYCA